MSKDYELVMVDTVSMFRMRYVVKVPIGKSEWALDTVTCNEAKEFSQKHLDETIVSHRVVTEEEYVKVFDEDNNYLKDVSLERKFEIGITDLTKETNG